MILLRLPIRPADNPPHVVAYRWAVDAFCEPSQWVASFGLVDLIKDTEGVWRLGRRYAVVNLTPHFRFGSQHDYYDGPHCTFSLVFLHFCWSYRDCAKCTEGL